MILSKLSLSNFKNYVNAELEFCDGLNCITGLNGSGKTNLLDAIHYLSLTKSAFNSIDSQNIRTGTDFFAINASLEIDQKIHTVHCSLKTGEKKNFKVDDSVYEKLSQHIGRFPVIIISPYDDELIRDSSEVRRKFFDSIISQTNKTYLNELIAYQHFLKQRNSMLKRIHESGQRDTALLDHYDEQIISKSLYISQCRAEFIDKLLPEFMVQYQKISEGSEETTIEYSTKIDDPDFSTLFKNSIEKDIVLHRTSFGAHRDDYAFMIEGKPLKKFGSQGQQKSFLISLKCAQFEFIKEEKKITPILLLDDIFDKLDDHRIKMLVEMIVNDKFGQIFLTDARKERTEQILAGLDSVIRIFGIEDNTPKILSDDG